jgi:hypothetical protein
LTAAALEAMPRRERVKVIWSALSPAGRARAWAGLDADQRADAIALLFDATDMDALAGPPRLTPSGVFDRWQRETER